MMSSKSGFGLQIYRLWKGRAFSAELKKVFWLALPLMLGELSSMLMGVAGTIMAGRLGATALAASGIASVVFVISMLLVWGSIRMIPTPIAEAHELREGARVRTLLLAGLLMGALLVLVCGALLWVGTHYFYLLDQDPEVAVLAISYLRIIVFSMPVLILFALLVNFMDAFSYVRITMFLSFFGLGLDIFLNWLLIFGHWGFPRMGLDAIAMNTGITHAVLSVILAGVILYKKDLAYMRTARSNWAAVFRQAGTFLRYGIPSALQIMVEFAAFGAGTVIVGQISATEQAAHQIAINLVSMTYVTIMGVSTAGMIRIGQALAYQSRVRVWLSGTATIVLAMLIMLVPTLVFLGLPHTVSAFYIEDPAVVQIATGLLLYAGLFQLADAAQASSISMLRALNDVFYPSLVSFVAFWVIGLPLGYWLAHDQGWNAAGVWMGYLLALAIQAIMFVWRFLEQADRVPGRKSA